MTKPLPQKEPDTSTTYWARRARGRYHSLGASSERRLYTERRATERHESREPQPRRVYPATRNAAARETLPTTRLKSSTGERLIFTVQQNQPASIDNHRQYHHVNDSHGPRVLSSDDMPQQRPQPDRHIGNPYRASSYDNARETPSTNRPVERHLHFRHRDQDIRPRPVPGADLSKVSNATRDFPEGASVPRNHHRVRNTLSETMDEAGNNVVSVFLILL